MKKFFVLIAIFILSLDAAIVRPQEQESYIYKLTQSNTSYQFWTTLPSERVFKDSDIPEKTGSQVKVYAARNEFEPFQIVVNPVSSGSVTVDIGDFGGGITSEIYQVKYIPITQVSDNLGRLGDYPDALWPIEKGSSVNVVANENTSFWFSIFVSKTTVCGDYTANVQIGGVSIPVTIHVFNFAIPDELHIESQMNFSHQTILNKYSVTGTGSNYWMYVDKMKQFFIDHRLNPASTLWSGGLTTNGAAPYIDYDCATETLTDNDGIWGFEQPADKYLNGNGFNEGTGFPSFMAAGFRNNDSSADQRPDTFCGISRQSSDWYTGNNPDSAYNRKWFNYMKEIQRYLLALGLLNKAYYYIANEPQDQADYDAVAWYSQELKKVAPNLKLMVSEEPKPEIYAHSSYTGAKIDIWLPVLNNYNPTVSHDRKLNHNEETWVYFLYGTRPPYFNPITLDHPGIESKFIGWYAWKYRIRGIAYYSLDDWSKNPWTNPMTSGHNGDIFMWYPPSEDNQAIPYGSNNHRFVPSIRYELMRDSLEEYEYLYVLNGNSQPEVGQENDADPQADKIIRDLTAYTRHSEFMYNLRRVIGLKNGNEASTVQDIYPPPCHPRAEGDPGNYYINFQNPSGSPTANPLIVNGKEYMKIGWNNYDSELGYGWYGLDSQVKYQYLSSGPNELQKSILYDDYGRLHTFEFDLPNATYNVTVSVGWQGKVYSHNKIRIEGVDFVNDEATNPYIVRTKELKVQDHKLTLEMGIFDEYTMLNYLDIEYVPDHFVSNPDTPSGADNGDAGESITYTTGNSTCTHAHSVQYQFDWGDSTTSDWGSSSASHTYGAAGTYSIRAKARCSVKPNIASEWSDSKSVTLVTHTVTTPSTPTGSDLGEIGENLTYETDGATCNQGHSVNYRFDWNDGSVSDWSSSTSVSHSYASAATYSIKSQARCVTKPNFVSSWSSGKSVTIYEHIVSKPDKPKGMAYGAVNESLTYTTGNSTCNRGHTVQYRFDWGDGNVADWASDTSLSHSYAARNNYEIKIQARCTVNTSIVSEYSIRCVHIATFIMDFERDGTSDFSVWNKETGEWRWIRSEDGSEASKLLGASGSLNYVIVPADYDGDKKTDIGVWNKMTGEWHYIRSSDKVPVLKNLGENGIREWIPIPGDYDGDGIADIAVWNKTASEWKWLGSSDGQTHSVTWGDAGVRECIPVPGDYDGDTKTDLCLWNKTTGNWHGRNSSDMSEFDIPWKSGGINQWIPVPGDYDGDLKTDLTVWNKSTGEWHCRKSSDTGSSIVKTWRRGGDLKWIPVPADYDGDGKYDLSVWHKERGQWYCLKSSDGNDLSSYIYKFLGDEGLTHWFPVTQLQHVYLAME